jgi:hypothetical protein
MAGAQGTEEAHERLRDQVLVVVGSNQAAGDAQETAMVETVEGLDLAADAALGRSVTPGGVVHGVVLALHLGGGASFRRPPTLQEVWVWPPLSSEAE